MHVHNHPTIFNTADLSSTRAERAASAQRSADVRRKLMKGGLEAESFESLILGREPEAGSQQRQRHNQQRNYANSADRLKPAVEKEEDQPLSLWA